MKRAISLSVLVFQALAITISSASKACPQELVNLALKANVSTSHVSPWERLDAVNDGRKPRNSSDKANGAYGNWNGDGDYNTYNWVQYAWEQAHMLSSTEVYWWDDGQGIDQPTDACIEYWNGSIWVSAGDIGTELNKYNLLNLDVRSNRIRIMYR